MIQKNYRSKDLGELKWNLQEITASEAYQRAGSVLAQVYIESWSKNHIANIMSTIQKSLTKAEVIGMTNVNRELFFSNPIFHEVNGGDGSAVIDLLCFESTQVEVCVFDTKSMPELIAGGNLGNLLSEKNDVKGVHLLTAGVGLAIEDFLTMASAENPDVVFFGQSASAGRWIEVSENEEIDGVVWYKNRMLNRGFIAVLLEGEQLVIRTGYNFGWTPIGKKMTVTGMRNEQVVSEIDSVPAAYVYKHYFGLEHSQLISENVCEFPFAVRRGDRLLARIGIGTDNPDDLLFSAQIFEGDELQLTYGDPEVIFAESFADAMEVRFFQPQAIQLIECLNRNVLLKEEVQIEHEYYESILKDLMITHGNSEILYDAEGGGELNSALVSVAMREGEPSEPSPQIQECDKARCKYQRKTIPLVHRMTRFLEATTHDLEEAVEQSVKANRAKSQFMSSISHEIRTPINAILGLDEMIVRESAEQNIRKYAMDIQNSGRTLLALINDLLDSSRIESGKLEIIPVEYELSSMLNDLVNMISVRAREKDLTFRVKVDSAIPHVLYGDDTRIKQCALNVLTNAVKYTNRGTVTLSVSFAKLNESRIGLSVTVEDTGIGIKEEDIPRLFTPFERIEEERNHSIEGTGLGMNIVKALLTLMDSSLQVKSVYGEGSVFSFTVEQEVRKWEPIGDFAEMYRQSMEETTHYRESFHAPDARILLVDDTRMNLTVIRGLLGPTQIQIDTAESGREALSLVRENHYDIILLDQRMPEMDGIETLRNMKSMYDNRNHGVPVIMLTANAVSGAREMFLEEGFDDYLSKPVNGKRLEQMIQSYLPQDKVISVYGSSDDEDPGLSSDRKDPEGEGISDEGTYEGQPFLQLLSKIKELSVSDGLTYCMDESVLKETIQDFVVAAADGVRVIQEFLDSGNIKDYTIRVHALKSSARLIGANGLSEQAKYLEDCGDAKDIDQIHARTGALLEAYSKLAQQLQNVLDGEDPAVEETSEKKSSGNTDSLPMLTTEQAEEAFRGVRELIEAFDFDGAADILGMLDAYRLPEEIQKQKEILSDSIRKLERDAILELLKK